MQCHTFIKVGLIIFHCIFLEGCYDFLDVWWLVINQAFMMSCERPPLGLPPAAAVDEKQDVLVGHHGHGATEPFPRLSSGTAKAVTIGGRGVGGRLSRGCRWGLWTLSCSLSLADFLI